MQREVQSLCTENSAGGPDVTIQDTAPRIAFSEEKAIAESGIPSIEYIS